PNSVKKPMLDKIQAKQSAPPPVDPKVAAQGQLKQMELQADGQKAVADNSLEWRKAQLQALTQIEVARFTAKTDQDSGTLAAKLEGILGFAQLAHEQNENAQDRAHEAAKNDADRRTQQGMAARQQAADAQQAAAQPAPQGG